MTHLHVARFAGAVRQMTHRTEIDDRQFGLTLAQAIILAQFGDVIVVHSEAQKQLGENIARMKKPDIKIDFVVEPIGPLRRLS